MHWRKESLPSNISSQLDFPIQFSIATTRINLAQFSLSISHSKSFFSRQNFRENNRGENLCLPWTSDDLLDSSTVQMAVTGILLYLFSPYFSVCNSDLGLKLLFNASDDLFLHSEWCWGWLWLNASNEQALQARPVKNRFLK